VRVLLTGATGFIGSHVTRHLLDQGHDVHVLLRESSDRWRITDLLDRVKVLHGGLPLTSDTSAEIARLEPQVCVHAAWFATPGEYLHSERNLDHVGASLGLARALAQTGCSRFVGLGTCFEYDTRLGYLSEGATPTRPASLYAASKLSTGLILERFGDNVGMDIAWARIFYQYGPYEDRRRLVPSVIRALLAGDEARVTRGEQVRDFLHIKDVAGALCAVALSDLRGPVNIGSGSPVTVRQVVNQIGALLGRQELVSLGALPYGPGDPMFVCADTSRLSDTGFTPSFGLRDGLADTIDWWRRNGQG
jgi:nucleoside-diphosphate-sugar epimerase